MTRPYASDAVVGSDRRVFAFQSCLGRGGFGEVYRATMSSAGGVRMEVAVKVLHAEVDPLSQAVQRLRDEARLLGAIRHPSVLAMHGLVMLDGRIALVTEYVEGADLDKCVRGDDPISRRALVEMTGRVAEALDAAWRAPSPDGTGPLRLVHRDIKPANIRLGKHGEVKLLDFGIARAGNIEREARTETNAMLGSYLYMAPERFLDGNDHGPAIDVFALGCTLFETLAGSRLFAELTLKDMYLLILDANKYERFVQERLDRLPRDLEPEIVSLLYRLVSLTPRERPQHAELARLCADLADRMKGRSLDRWARGRVWPPPKQVRGVLDGAVLTESTLSVSDASALLAPGPTPLDSPGPGRGAVSGRSAVPGAVSGVVSRRRTRDTDTFEGVVSRTVSATFERPSVVVGMGFGVVGLGALAAGAVLAVLVVVGGLWVWWREPPPPVGLDVVVAPAPRVEPPVVRAPPPLPDPGSRDGDRPAAPRPTAPGPGLTGPGPSPDPSPPSDPAPVVVTPVPVAAPVVVVTPPPAPAPAPAGNATVLLVGDSKVLVEFKGPSGTTRSRLLPPGQYDVIAWFNGRPNPVPNSTNYLAAGVTYRLKCSDFKQTCSWEK